MIARPIARLGRKPISRSTSAESSPRRITILDPNGGAPEHVALPDALTTNICFGGEDLKTAFVTLSSTGQLVSLPWENPGLPLNYLNR